MVVVDKFEEDARSSGRNDKLLLLLLLSVVVVESTVAFSTSIKDFVGCVGKGAPEYFLIPNFILDIVVLWGVFVGGWEGWFRLRNNEIISAAAADS